MNRFCSSGIGLAARLWLIVALVALTIPAFALHPLITDDTGTQGKGMFEVEFNYAYENDKYAETVRDPKEIVESYWEGQSTFGRVSVKDDTNVAGIGITYGIIDPLDISIGIPYQHSHSREKHLFYTGPFAGFAFRESETVTGLSDVNIEFKWKFFEYKALTLAIKPGAIIPTGDEDKGLGAGKFGAYGYFITTLDFNPVVMHLNLGYIRNQNRANEREDIWHASLAFEIWAVKDYLRFVANAGFERNRDKRSNIQDVFLLAGVIVSPTPDCDLDLGFKYSVQGKGWESPGPDYSVLAGATVRFGFAGAGDKGGDDKEKTEKKGGK
ncbi:MAG TPA: transporter [Spirochaetota bacterium]|nr:transporter [Spirochaetota bacterium]HQF10173.1 transporter [Spirochaetota bacterium]HQH98957.1 transporter [Spirochaetota bacterium]HQJ71934.1 transporter [Spirochaetota bacterium]HRS78738.1 transporter [Spirochaetota bacterium]